MEKGLKTLQTAARTAHRKAAAESQNFDERGISDHNSDSGIGLGSDVEMEVGDEAGSSSKAPTWHAHQKQQQQRPCPQDHTRSRSLPQPLPLYQPPAPLRHNTMTTSPDDMTFTRRDSGSQRWSPDSQNGRGGISISSIVST